MKINGNIKKHIVLTTLAGATIALVLIGVVIIQFGTQAPTDIPTTPTLGKIISSQMEEKIQSVEYLWCYNNSWINLNISSHYTEYIDGLLVKQNADNTTSDIALIHEPTADIEEVAQSNIDKLMFNFTKAIATMEEASTNQSFDDIFPPTMMLDIGYDNGDAIGLFFSLEDQILGVINGTWEETDWVFHGVNVLHFSYDYDKMVYLYMDNVQSYVTALKNFEDYVISVFPSNA